MTFNPPPILNPNRTAHDLAERLPWKNTAGESCPAYGVFRIDSFNETTLHWDAKKPDGEEGLYYANGPVPVANTKYGGAAMWNLPRRVLVDVDTLAVGDEVGPVDGEWHMSASGAGWRIMRPPETGGTVATVERVLPAHRRIQVMMKEDLLAAVDCQTDPSTAAAYVMRRKPDGDMETTDREITIVNRFQEISVDAGTYAKAEWIDGEWQLYAADCATDASFSTGDVVSE